MGDAELVGVVVGVLVGVDVGVLVGVDVGVLVGVDVGVLVGVDVGVLVGVDVGVLVGVDVGVLVGVVPPLGPVALVEYELPSEDSVTKMDWVYSTVPVPPAALQQPTAHSAVPPSGIWAKASSAPTLPSRDPLNAPVSPMSTAGEMRVARVAPLNSPITADAWKPVGHPSVVDHVGVEEAAPLAGLSVRLPGCDPTPASADAAVSSPAPAARPIIARRTSHLTFASRSESRTF
jgi:hypothetical protein